MEAGVGLIQCFAVHVDKKKSKDVQNKRPGLASLLALSISLIIVLRERDREGVGNEGRMY
jgi:hypothetical protein